MEQLLFLLVLAFTLLLTGYSINEIVFKGKWEWVIFFACFYFPFYTNILSIVWQATGSIFLLSFFRYLKEIMVLLAALSFLVYERDLFGYAFRFHLGDKLLLGFLGIGLIYLFLPLGEANWTDKALYLKNIFLMAVFYFFGRNSRLSEREIARLFKGIMVIAIAAFLLNILETIIGRHFQQFTGYALFNADIYNMDPTGNYGLTWTFETQTTGMRLASFFADPLELASSCLLGFSVGLIWYLTTKREEGFFYVLVMIAAVGSIFFSASRAAFAAFFWMIFFVAIIFRLNKLLLMGAGILILFGIYIVAFASDDFYYFVYDTLTFQNPSSVGHVVEWLLAVDAMVQNPEGIGLAMSGNTGSVQDELRVGGENQYLIFGVQMGIVGMLLYIALLVTGIVTSMKLFYQVSNTMIARVAFVAATVKFGMLLPLFTSNAENFLYVALLTWWMVGYSIKAYHQYKFNLPTNSLLLEP